MSRRVENSDVQRGRNRTDRVPSDTALVHCKRCNFVLNTRLFPRGNSKRSDGNGGLSYTTYSYSQGGITKYYGDPEVSGGCPFCGTYEY